MATTTSSYQQLYERRVALAMERAKALQNRPTTALARDFFAIDSTQNNDISSWKSLPQRLLKLSNYLRNNNSNNNADI